jgi:hypothetical protein
MSNSVIFSEMYRISDHSTSRVTNTRTSCDVKFVAALNYLSVTHIGYCCMVFLTEMLINSEYYPTGVVLWIINPVLHCTLPVVT